VSAAKRVRAGIGRSFQTPTVFESLTVIENLDLSETYRFGLRRMLRKRKGVSDGVADFAAALADPASPWSMRPSYNSGDNIHPSDQGYRAMANAVPLSWADFAAARQ